MGGNGEELMATYLVTGANRGIGLAYCQQLQARGDAVIAVCRQLSPELESLGVQLETAIERATVKTPHQLIDG